MLISSGCEWLVNSVSMKTSISLAFRLSCCFSQRYRCARESCSAGRWSVKLVVANYFVLQLRRVEMPRDRIRISIIHGNFLLAIPRLAYWNRTCPPGFVGKLGQLHRYTHVASVTASHSPPVAAFADRRDAMNDKTIKERELIDAYRQGARRHRSESLLNSHADTVVDGVSVRSGTVTVWKKTNSKSISALGGATKVFGKSKISIPNG